jgi:hypothetical protein
MLIALITDTHLGDTTLASVGADPEKNLDLVLSEDAPQLEFNIDPFGYRLINVSEAVTTQLYINRGNGFVQE